MSDVEELVKEILDLSGKIKGPDSDPGDIDICVQDDMPLVTVGQGGWDTAVFVQAGQIAQDPYALVGLGDGIVSALEDYIVKLKAVLESIDTKNL